MTAPVRQPAPVDAEGALDFSTPKAAAPFPRVVLQVLIQDEDGDVWSATFNDVALSTAKARIQQLGCKIVGAASPNAQGAATSSSAPPTCQNRNCSSYGKPMEPSGQRPGTYYCKGKDATTGNQKGYCKSSG